MLFAGVEEGWFIRTFIKDAKLPWAHMQRIFHVIQNVMQYDKSCFQSWVMIFFIFIDGCLQDIFSETIFCAEVEKGVEWLTGHLIPFHIFDVVGKFIYIYWYLLIRDKGKIDSYSLIRDKGKIYTYLLIWDKVSVQLIPFQLVPQVPYVKYEVGEVCICE